MAVPSPDEEVVDKGLQTLLQGESMDAAAQKLLRRAS